MRHSSVVLGVVFALFSMPVGVAYGDPACTITGTAGDNTIVGTSGDDVICGLEGNDRLEGRGGNDTLIGGAGGDRLVGGNGTDALQGDAGPDNLDGGAGPDTFDGGDGIDRATYTSRSTPVIVTIGAGANDGAVGEGDEVSATVENVYGGKGDDTLTGDSARNLLFGDAGNDTLDGAGGRDVLTGSTGNDTLTGGTPGIGERDTLGCGAGTDTYTPDPIDVLDNCETPAGGGGGLALPSRLGAGDYHTCAVRTNGTVACWGYNESGQLGNGSTVTRLAPVDVVGLTDAIDVDGSDEHTCALRASGAVSCWGSNASGQLGDGTTAVRRTTPVPVDGLNDAIAISVDEYTSCALRRGGGIVCWGESAVYEGGDFLRSLVPASVPTTTGTVAIDLRTRLCAVTNAGGVSCSPGVGIDPYPIPGAGGVKDVAGGGNTVCALRFVGTVGCWGSSEYGLLGDGIVDPDRYVDLFADAPAGVVGLTDVTAIAAGDLHTCALSPTQLVSVRCWGINADGQLGDGTTTDRSTALFGVSGLTDATEITAGAAHSCAIRAGGSVVCWGNNDLGQLGDGTTSSVPYPVLVGL